MRGTAVDDWCRGDGRGEGDSRPPRREARSAINAHGRTTWEQKEGTEHSVLSPRVLGLFATAQSDETNGASRAVPTQAGLTFSARGPLGPWPRSNVTDCPSR